MVPSVKGSNRESNFWFCANEISDSKSLSMNSLSRHSITQCNGKFLRLPYVFYPKGPATKV